MENVSEHSFPQNDFTKKASAASRSSTHLIDLNPDCLRIIFQHLDLATQFSLIRSSNYFSNIIVYDIWHQYFNTAFNIIRDCSIPKQSTDFQTDFLDFILQHFPKVTGIYLEIFQRCIEKSSVKDFPLTKSLIIHTRSKTLINFDLEIFHKLPNLQEISLETINIDFSNNRNFVPLKGLHLRNVTVVNHVRGEIFKNVFTACLEKFTIRSFPSTHFHLKNFIGLSKCVGLKDLTLSYEYFYNADILNLILKLPCLQILTIEADDSYNYTGNFHYTCVEILKRLSDSPCKAIKGLQYKGMPNKDLLLSPYLQGITSLSWIWNMGYSVLPDGSVAWNLETIEFTQFFYDYVVNNKSLEQLLLVNNSYHKHRMTVERDFEEKIQELRRVKGFVKLNIVNDNNFVHDQYHANICLCNFSENTISFFIEKKE